VRSAPADPDREQRIRTRAISPLRKGEVVTVARMAPEGDCKSDMLVIIEWCERTLGVSLGQLEAVGVDEETARAVADWHYWVERGYEL